MAKTKKYIDSDGSWVYLRYSKWLKKCKEKKTVTLNPYLDLLFFLSPYYQINQLVSKVESLSPKQANINY